MLVNWIGVTLTAAKGQVTYRSAFVTSLPVTRDTVACARTTGLFNAVGCGGG